MLLPLSAGLFSAELNDIIYEGRFVAPRRPQGNPPDATAAGASRKAGGRLEGVAPCWVFEKTMTRSPGEWTEAGLLL